MKIYTKRGDKGTTSLFGGKKVSKADPQIEAYATIDELNSYLGVVIACTDDVNAQKDLLTIQKRLFDLGVVLATDPEKPELIKPFDNKHILFLEQKIDKMETKLQPLKNFILPSGSLLIAHTHVARTLCRKAERRVVAVANNQDYYQNILIYLNRLSDYLFVLTRKFANDTGVKENIWDNND